MTRRYQFGPVDAAYAERYLQRQRDAGVCLTFNAEGTADLTIGAADSWAEVCARFPDGWQPEYLAAPIRNGGAFRRHLSARCA